MIDNLKIIPKDNSLDEFIIELSENLLMESKEKNIKQIAIAYELKDGTLKSKRASNSWVSLVGLVEWIKLRWLDEANS